MAMAAESTAIALNLLRSVMPTRPAVLVDVVSPQLHPWATSSPWAPQFDYTHTTPLAALLPPTMPCNKKFVGLT